MTTVDERIAELVEEGAENLKDEAVLRASFLALVSKDAAVAMLHALVDKLNVEIESITNQQGSK